METADRSLGLAGSAQTRSHECRDAKRVKGIRKSRLGSVGASCGVPQ